MKKQNSYRVLDEIAREHLSQSTNLLPGILADIKKERIMKKRTRLLAAIPLAILIFIIISISVPDIAQAMKRLLGYIPGIGVVEQNTPLRILESPVDKVHGDIKVSIEQAVLDSEHTVILFTVQNIPAPVKTEDSNPWDYCHLLPTINLPDGTQLSNTDATGESWSTGYKHRFTYPAIPMDVNDAVLFFPCLQNMPKDAGEAYLNWEVPLHFVPAPPEMVVYPIIDFPTLTPAPTNETSAVQTQAEETIPPLIPSSDDISMFMERYVPLDESHVLHVVLQAKENAPAFRFDILDSYSVHLFDAAGVEIPLEEQYLEQETVSRDGKKYSFVYQTVGSFTPGEATLVVDAIWASIEIPNSDIHFTFDPGENSQPGQTWQIDENLNVLGYPIHVHTISRGKNADGFIIEYDCPDNVAFVTLMDNEHKQIGGGGGTGSSGFTYADGFPTGPITITANNISVLLAGPWQTTLELPEALSMKTPTPAASTPCLTHDVWEKAVSAAPSALPVELTGTIAISDPSDDDEGYMNAWAGTLPGGERQQIGRGYSPALSPDSSQLIYTNDKEGLTLVDLASGTQTALPDTTRADLGAVWSPDGTQFVFTHGPSVLIGAPGPYDLMLANSDGSNIQTILSNNDANQAMAWLPDGKRILYTVKGPEGASVHTIDLQSDEITLLFTTNYMHSSIAVSPDGSQVAFEDMLPGERYSIFIANLDGSNRRLLADSSPAITTSPIWSPDGKWIAATAWDPNISDSSDMLVFIEVSTCRVIVQPDMTGNISTWNR